MYSGDDVWAFHKGFYIGSSGDILELIKQVEKVPEKFLKHLTGTNGLYEIRIEYKSNTYRIFCCFDKGRLVVLLNGFQKKTQKTPKNELEKALILMNEYFQQKKI
jgi:phage-related protein